MMKKWNTVLQQFFTYVAKNLIKKIRILKKSNIIAITEKYPGLVYLLCNQKYKEHNYICALGMKNKVL